MKRLLKFLICVIIGFVFMFAMAGCTNQTWLDKYAPWNQDNTTWTSEDGVITFKVYEEYAVFYDISEAPVLTELAQKSQEQVTSNTYGTITVAGEEYYFYMEVYGDLSAVFVSTKIAEVQHEGKSIFEVEDDYTLLTGSIDIRSERKFVLTVYSSQFYEEGTEIIFRRVEED